MKRLSIVISLLGGLAGIAYAGHDLAFDFSLSPASAGANADTSSFVDQGTNIAKSMTAHLPPGLLLAHADDATSPVSPPPVNGDQVGDGVIRGDLWNDGCGNPTDNALTITWVEPIGAGAPAGTVAELQLEGTPLPGLTITKRGFIVRKGRDSFHRSTHYDLVVPDMPDEYSCGGSSSWINLNTYGTVSGTNRVVEQNPASGTYTAYVEYTDTGNTTHTDSDTVAVTK